MDNNPCSVTGFSSLFSLKQWWNGDALSCEQQPSEITNGQTMIQSVADNAATYYGSDSAVAQAAAASVAQQQALVPSDNYGIITDINNSTPSPSDLLKKYGLYAVGALAALVVIHAVAEGYARR